MTNRFVPCVLLLCAVFTVPLATARAPAADTGRLLRLGAHLANECATCHGSTGGSAPSQSGTIPPLAGRPAADVRTALHDFRDGRRTNAIMASVAQSLNDEQIEALAAYFASLPAADASPD